MKHLIIYSTIVTSIFFSSCSNYLDIVPENDIETIETIFEKREQAELWLKSCYVLMTDPVSSVIVNPAFTGTDEVVAGEYTRQLLTTQHRWQWYGLFIGDGLQMVQEPYANIWKKDLFYAAIRYCNIFFEKIGGVYNMPDNEKALWVAELKALKAQLYFELMRRYGPIILVPENIEVNSDIEIMQQPRSPIDTCVNTIVRLLDEAMKVLPPFMQKDQSRWTYHSLESAATLKAQVLLYAASPLFNGNPAYTNFKNKKGEQLFNTTYDHEKWKRAAEATDEAIQLCLDGGRQLVTGNMSKSTELLNTMMDIENSVVAPGYANNEAIYMIRPQGQSLHFWYSWTLPYFKSTDYANYNASMKGCISPSIKMVEMYYTEHGLPIDADKEWDYSSRYQMGKESSPLYRDVIPLNSDVLGLHLRREPRFYASIAADRCYWQRGKDAAQNLIVKAYRGEQFGTHTPIINNSYPQNLSGYWLKKGSYSNVSTRDYSSAIDNREEGAIIFRLAELYLMKAEAWNEYLETPDAEHVYNPLNAGRERAGIPDVESAWTNYSKTPDKVKTKTGMREIIRQEWNIEFAFEGRRFWNLRRWLTAADELNTDLYGWNILGETAHQFYNNFDGPVVVWSKREFVAPRDYLFPIRSEEVMVAGCVQNPGW